MRYELVRELVKNPELRIKDIAEQTGYNKGHVSRLRKEAMRQAIKQVEKAPRFTAWQCQCGKAYEVTCISSKLPKKEWVGLTDEEADELVGRFARYELLREVEAKLKEKNHG